MYDIHYSVNSKDVQFTKTRLLAYLKQHNEMGYVSLKKKLGEWILRIMSDDKSTDTQVKLSVTDYINHDLKLIIEYDEKYHERQKEKDIKRQEEIEKHLSDYKFYRIKESHLTEDLNLLMDLIQ